MHRAIRQQQPDVSARRATPLIGRHARNSVAAGRSSGETVQHMPKKNVYDPGDPGFTLVGSPFYLMAHADHKYHEDMDQVLIRRGMSKPIYRILTVLREHEPASIGAIATA